MYTIEYIFADPAVTDVKLFKGLNNLSFAAWLQDAADPWDQK